MGEYDPKTTTLVHRKETCSRYKDDSLYIKVYDRPANSVFIRRNQVKNEIIDVDYFNRILSIFVKAKLLGIRICYLCVVSNFRTKDY